MKFEERLIKLRKEKLLLQEEIGEKNILRNGVNIWN